MLIMRTELSPSFVTRFASGPQTIVPAFASVFLSTFNFRPLVPSDSDYSKPREATRQLVRASPYREEICTLPAGGRVLRFRHLNNIDL
jgi:hypothetical protein